MYKALAPSWDIIKTSDSIEEYEPRYYAEVLDLLDPHKVLEDITKLAAGNPPVLLCFETTPLHRDNFCHRTMAGAWLRDKLGVVVEEWSGAKESNPRQTTLVV
jgi:hypothetical protein